MPDSFKNVKIIELMELFDDEEVTTADQIKERPQKALDREMFQNAFKEKKADGGRIGFKSAGFVKKLLAQADSQGVKAGPGRKLNEEEIEKKEKFMDAFLEYANKKHDGVFSKAAAAIGESREKIKGIFDRVRFSKTGTRKGADVGAGAKMKTTIPTPENVIPYTEATTLVKKDKNYLKNKIKNFDKDKFYSPKDIGNILGFDVSEKKFIDRITGDLKRFGVATKQRTGQQKLYKLGDVVNKITKGYEKKLVKGQKSALSTRLENELKLDPELKKFIANFNTRVRNISKEEDIFLKNAVEDVGHPLSIKITGKYPKLTKNSNINKLNTLTFQDPVVNQKVLEATGYESKHDALLKRLNKLVNKKVGPKEMEELQDFKSQMNALYSKAIADVSNLAKKGTTLYNPRTKKTTVYQGSYFKGQEERIPKIDINIPKQGETFKSENLFVDMSNINPAFRVGLANDINPNAKFFNDLSDKQKQIYKRNVLDQTKFNIDKFYSKAGFPREQINELKDSLEFGTATKLGIPVTATLATTAAAADDGTKATGLTTGEKIAGGAAAAGTLGSKTGRNIARRIIGGAFGPTGIGLLTGTSGGYDFRSPFDRLLLSSEAALAPELVKGTIGATKGMKNRALQKIAQRALNLGMSVPTALKVARFAQPLGVMGGVIEGSVAAGKNISQEANRIADIKDPDLQQLEYENFIKNIKGFAGGGLAKQAGDRSGAMLQSMNPDSQGLSGLLKRGKKI